MSHPNKNELAAFFYKEISIQRGKAVQRHLLTCPECRYYVAVLSRTAELLTSLPVESPAANSFEKIMSSIPKNRPQPSRVKSIIPVWPIFEFTIAIIMIIASIILFQNRLTETVIWNTLQQTWVIKTIGSYGFTAVIFFSIGSFITLALAPILYFESLKIKPR